MISNVIVPHYRSRSFASAMRLTVVLLALGTCRGSTLPTSVVIEWNDRHQTIDGFGASSSNFIAPLSDADMDFFFTPGGIGLSLLRTRIFPSVGDCQADMDPGGACVPSPSATLLTGELRMAQLVVARGGRVWGSEWSPPGPMKANHVFTSGGAFVSTSENLKGVAAILADFTSLLRRNGVPLHAISMQNEPDVSRGYPSATWTAEQIRDEIPYLRGALASAGASDTLIMIPEQSTWASFSLASAAMGDAAIAGSIGILAAHNYDHLNPTAPPRLPNRTTQRLWQTEVSGFGPFDGSMADALVWAEKIHWFLSAAQVNAFHYWYLSGLPNRRTDNEALTDERGRPARRAFAIGNWSRFVRPGWYEVGVRNTGTVLVSAFEAEQHGQAAIVVVNRQRRSALVHFVVGDGMGAAVVPWITSQDHALTPMTAVPIVSGMLSYSVPASSVVTLAAGS